MSLSNRYIDHLLRHVVDELNEVKCKLIHLSTYVKNRDFETPIKDVYRIIGHLQNLRNKEINK